MCLKCNHRTISPETGSRVLALGIMDSTERMGSRIVPRAKLGARAKFLTLSASFYGALIVLGALGVAFAK